MTDAQDEYEDEIYQKFKQRFIEEGFIEANPKRWVRPKFVDIYELFDEKLSGKKTIQEIRDISGEFYNHWNDLNWYRGKTRMKSYGGSINTWIKNNERFKQNDSGKTRKLSVSEQVAANIASRENENAASPEESGQIVADYG